MSLRTFAILPCTSLLLSWCVGIASASSDHTLLEPEVSRELVELVLANSPAAQGAFVINEDGMAVHTLSGLICNGGTQELPLTAINIFSRGANATDVGCEYSSEGSKVSIYATLDDGKSLKEHFEYAVAAIKAYTSDIEITPGIEMPIWPEAFGQVDTFGLSLTGRMKSGPDAGSWVLQSLRIAKVEDWILKIRATSPRNEDNTTESFALVALIVQVVGMQERLQD